MANATIPPCQSSPDGTSRTLMPHPDAMAVPIDVACEYCGWDGTVVADIVDEIQCPMCGEPVTPQANMSGGN